MLMPILVVCPGCGRRFDTSESAIGQRLECPDCGLTVALPDGSISQGRREGESAAGFSPFGSEDVDPYADRSAGVGVEENQKTGIAYPEHRRAELRSVAVDQRAILIAMLIQIICNIVAFNASLSVARVLLITSLLVGLASLFFILRLATKLYNVFVGFFLGILCVVPCLGLLMLFVINGRATRLLQQNGIRVGLIGANLSQFETN
jgi:hypothetical protein